MYEGAAIKFAELLRTRERVVTEPDIEIVSQAFEPRIRRVDVHCLTEVTPAGLRPVETVGIHVDPDDFPDPEADLPRLARLLEEYLNDRAIIGHEMRVHVSSAS